MATRVERESQYLSDLLEEDRYRNEIQTYADLLTGAYKTAEQQYQASAQTAAEKASYDISGAYANYLKQQRNIVSQGRLESGYKEELSNVLQEEYQSAYSQAKNVQEAATTTAAETYQKEASTAYAEYLKNLEAVEKVAKTEAGYRANLHEAIDNYVETNLSNYTSTQKSQATGEAFNIYETVNGVEQLTSYGKSIYTKALLEDEGFKKYLQEEGLTDELQYYLSDSSKIHKDLFDISYTGTLDAAAKKDIMTGILKTDDYIESVSKPSLDLAWKGDKKQKQNISENVSVLYNTYMPNIGAETITGAMVKDAVEKYIATIPVATGSQGLPQLKKNRAMREVTEKLSGGNLTQQQLINYFNDLVDDNRITDISPIFDYIIKELEAQSIKTYRGE